MIGKPANYHSALQDEADEVPYHFVEFPAGVAFVHDIHLGLSPRFSTCDCFYGDPPWRAGHAKFDARAGLDTGPFDRLLGAIRRVITANTRPMILTVGKIDSRFYPTPAFCEDGLLRGAKAKMLCYGFSSRPEVFAGDPPSSLDVLQWLAGRYDVIGDFFCGYGNSGRIFVEAGKRCVLSDYNQKCICYIAAHNFEWTPHNKNL